MRLGIIADDFTGATDIAGFLVAEGVPTTQLIGVPDGDIRTNAAAVVVSLKSRSCPADRAVTDSLRALEALRRAGARRIYLKYCSTFDSTGGGNIGPVVDALMEALETDLTVLCPALPVNGRTVYQGYLFVHGVLLEESGMRHHPVTPMTDSHIGRLMERQASGRAGLVPADVVEGGPEVVSSLLRKHREDGVRYAVLDVVRRRDLDVHAAAIEDFPLATGGSGLAAAIAARWNDRVDPEEAARPGRPQPGPGVVLSGSCSEMTQAQVAAYAVAAPARALDVDRCVTDDAYAGELSSWVLVHQDEELSPMLYATTGPDSLQRIQSRLGDRAAEAIEGTFAAVAVRVAEEGTTRFVVAGGETAGAVVQALGIRGYHVGPQIAPGVPWVRAIARPYSMALKSGNFGSERFFFDCQEDCP